MSARLKLFAALNVLGWLVAVPLLVLALLDPFVNLGDWPAGSLREPEPASVSLPRAEPPAPAPEASRPVLAAVIPGTGDPTALPDAGPRLPRLVPTLPAGERQPRSRRDRRAGTRPPARRAPVVRDDASPVVAPASTPAPLPPASPSPEESAPPGEDRVERAPGKGGRGGDGSQKRKQAGHGDFPAPAAPQPAPPPEGGEPSEPPAEDGPGSSGGSGDGARKDGRDRDGRGRPKK